MFRPTVIHDPFFHSGLTLLVQYLDDDTIMMNGVVYLR